MRNPEGTHANQIKVNGRCDTCGQWATDMARLRKDDQGWAAHACDQWGMTFPQYVAWGLEP